METRDFSAERGRMVQGLRERGIRDERVLSAMAKVPRHRFVPGHLARDAYDDRPLPIGLGQTISQPYIVAVMLESLALGGQERVLEVGTGTGYEATLLGELGRDVITIERHVQLAGQARAILRDLGVANVRVLVRDGSKGYERGGPYQAIVVAAAAPDAPDPLLEQLANGGSLVCPIGREAKQTLYRFVREGYDIRREAIAPVAFVPLVGRYGFRSEEKPIQW